MTVITLSDYFMGRDRTHGLQLGTDLRRNAERTVDLLCQLLTRAQAAGWQPTINPRTGSLMSSGWRPPSINDATKRSSATSLHLTCEAGDVYDPDGALCRWLKTAAGLRALEELGLWMEDPAYTPTWAHVQTKPPGSGRRYFIPR